MAYNFLVYQGKNTEIDQAFSKLGLGASVVLHLVKDIEAKGHELYFDNFFTTYQLLEILSQKEFNAAGTIRVNRFNNPPFIADKVLNKKGRGSNDEVISENNEIVLVKW